SCSTVGRRRRCIKPSIGNADRDDRGRRRPVHPTDRGRERPMRQILLNSGGAVVARVPRPIVERGSVLVRVHYSLISVGTEIAPLRSVAAAAPDSSAVERGIEYASLAKHYFRASLRDPRKAIARATKIARSQIGRLKPARPVPVTPAAAVDDLSW